MIAESKKSSVLVPTDVKALVALYFIPRLLPRRGRTGWNEKNERKSTPLTPPYSKELLVDQERIVELRAPLVVS
jgi:hypothetical protein